MISCLDASDSGSLIVHGRSCPWDYTFQPVDQERKSVIDYCIMDPLKVLEAGVCGRDVADVGSDHTALYVRADWPGFSLERRRDQRGRTAARRAGRRRAECQYSRRKLRECDPSVVCVLVSQLIERRIEAGDIARGMCDISEK